MRRTTDDNLKGEDDNTTNRKEMESRKNSTKNNTVTGKNDAESTIRLSLKGGRITELPKDVARAPLKVQLSQEFHKKSQEALQCAKKSRNEWGYFIHVTEEGRLQPGPLKEGISHTWISLEEYAMARQHDKTIHGLMHTHLQERTVFSPSNIGFFLATNDSIYKCLDPSGNYLIMLRTENTDSPWDGIFREAVRAYVDMAREKARYYFIETGLPEEDARQKGLFEAMREVCKKYNIALYLGKDKKAAQKVVWVAKSEHLKQKLVQRAEAHIGIFDDWDGLDAFMEAVIAEAREEKEKAKQDKEREEKELAHH